MPPPTQASANGEARVHGRAESFLGARAPGAVPLLGELADLVGGCALVVPEGRAVRARVHLGEAGLTATDRSCGAEEAWFPGEEGPLGIVGHVAALLHTRWSVATAVEASFEGDLPLGRAPNELAARAAALVGAWSRRMGATWNDAEKANAARLACHHAGAPDAGILAVAGVYDAAVHVRVDGEACLATPLDTHLHVSVGRLHGLPTPEDALREMALLLRGEFPARDLLAHQRVATVRNALDELAMLATHARRVSEAGDLAALGNLLDQAQRVTERELAQAAPELVSTASARTARRMRDNGALGARALLSEPGTVVALWRNAAEADAAVQMLDAMGMRAEAIHIGD